MGFIYKNVSPPFLLNGKTEEKAPLLWSERESNETSAGIEEEEELGMHIHILTQSYNSSKLSLSKKKAWESLLIFIFPFPPLVWLGTTLINLIVMKKRRPREKKRTFPSILSFFLPSFLPSFLHRNSEFKKNRLGQNCDAFRKKVGVKGVSVSHPSISI